MSENGEYFPYSSCKICSGLFLTPLRKQHMLIHEHKHPVYLCAECHVAFARKVDLSRHVNDAHGVISFMCGVCTKR